MRRIVSSPAVFADPETGRLAGLWSGGDHGDGTQESRQTNQCHDITVFPEAGIAGMLPSRPCGSPSLPKPIRPRSTVSR